MIQATETEHNIKTIIELQRYLYKKKSSLVLYGYDSFLFDFDKQDGLNTLSDLQIILEKDKFITKMKKGFTFGDLK